MIRISLISLTLIASMWTMPGLAEDPLSGRGEKDEPEASTHLDFDSTMVDGKMKAPSGFFLQGRNRQNLESMVRLRSDFRDRLRNSRSAVKAMVR
jgi:hypothetical protein